MFSSSVKQTRRMPLTAPIVLQKERVQQASSIASACVSHTIHLATMAITLNCLSAHSTKNTATMVIIYTYSDMYI